MHAKIVFFIVFTVRDVAESKYPSIVFLNICCLICQLCSVLRFKRESFTISRHCPSHFVRVFFSRRSA